MCQGGVSIRIHNDIKQHIQNVGRVGRRITKLTLASGKSAVPVAVLVTYATHKGYKRETRNKHWQQVGIILETMPETQLCIWCDGANGELGSRTRTAPELAKIIDMDTMAEKQNQETENATKTCIGHEMILMNTWRRNPGGKRMTL